MLLQSFGSEGAVEQIPRDALEALAAAFACGYNYQHRELPAIDETIDLNPNQESSHALTIRAEHGRFHFYDAQDEDGAWWYLFLNPDTRKSWKFENDEQNEAREPWRA